MNKEKKINYLDKEEKDLIDAVENIDLSSLPNPSLDMQKKLKQAASNFIKQEAKMNIRINAEELEKIKARAAHEGLKYQSFVKSVLHKYITGQLVDVKSN